MKGEKLSEQVPFTLKLTAKPEILQSNLTYNCYYWDDENKQWSSSGIETSVKNQSVFFCESDVLAIYAVIGTVPSKFRMKKSRGIAFSVKVIIVGLIVWHYFS